MAFILKHLRTENPKLFSIRDILMLLGDAINDEIRLHGEVYRISTCQEVGQGDGGTTSAAIDWQIQQFSISENGQNLFPLADEISDPESTFLTVNSVLYAQGEHKDYHIQGSQLIWHGAFALETSDKIILRYPISIFSV